MIVIINSFVLVGKYRELSYIALKGDRPVIMFEITSPRSYKGLGKKFIFDKIKICCYGKLATDTHNKFKDSSEISLLIRGYITCIGNGAPIELIANRVEVFKEPKEEVY